VVDRWPSAYCPSPYVIDVAFTREELAASDVAVVIDVLRATSTATQALASGYRRVLFDDGLGRARSLRGPGRVLAGERHCLMPDGFDQGNSPLDASRPQGRELVLATTNGAPTIVAAAEWSETVLLGCLLNLAAVLCDVRERIDPERSKLQLVCSGTDGEPALEDVYVAGRISAALPGPRSDSAVIAEAVAHAYAAPADALGASADARVLRDNGMERDIAYCSIVSRLDCVPVVSAAQRGVAVVVDRTARPDAIGTPAGSPFDSGDTVAV
jgi:2-phosphosulfolactate phosphatase